MPHQSEQHRTPVNDRKSPKKKIKSGVLALLEEHRLHPTPSEAHKKPPPAFGEV